MPTSIVIYTKHTTPNGLPAIARIREEEFFASEPLEGSAIDAISAYEKENPKHGVIGAAELPDGQLFDTEPLRRIIMALHADARTYVILPRPRIEPRPRR